MQLRCYNVKLIHVLDLINTIHRHSTTYYATSFNCWLVGGSQLVTPNAFLSSSSSAVPASISLVLFHYYLLLLTPSATPVTCHLLPLHIQKVLWSIWHV